MSEAIGSIGVVGGGFMGAGIAEVAAVAGMDVVVRELPEYLDGARQRLESSMDRAVQRGKLDAADRDSALARVTLTSDLSDLSGAELVVEAVPEVVELKIELMEALGGVVNGDTIIASNTSSIPIANWRAGCRTPIAWSGCSPAGAFDSAADV